MLKRTPYWDYCIAIKKIKENLPISDETIRRISNDPLWSYLLLLRYHKQLNQEHKKYLLKQYFLQMIANPNLAEKYITLKTIIEK